MLGGGSSPETPNSHAASSNGGTPTSNGHAYGMTQRQLGMGSPSKISSFGRVAMDIVAPQFDTTDAPDTPVHGNQSLITESSTPTRDADHMENLQKALAQFRDSMSGGGCGLFGSDIGINSIGGVSKTGGRKDTLLKAPSATS
eukprot:NODE_1622_length_1354_cov_6.458238_g1343_i0.p3 GENE.NODE_1622_length_1354_cov_6.458238_g1343_i0~~NODE_1622_length_1354_cov_6.458238_g1343_i0.p3  ORF type:complete len:143 (+),score=23.28 NODE_1622_length_1354_cov_6.458238_g1343_i0:497-925(+)